jgi:Mn-dependent DtxR family transcriptional regulator
MKDAHPHPTNLSEAERELIERLRERPELLERFAAIVELSASTEKIKQADEIEELLVEEIRRLGNVTMDPSAVVRKKNAELVVCLWCG